MVLVGLVDRLRSKFGDRRHTASVTSRASLEELSVALSSSKGEASGVALASAIIDRYQTLDDRSKIEYLSWLCQSLAPDPQRLDAATRAYLHDPSETNIIELSRAVEAPRQEFLRRLNQAPGATSVIVGMRSDLLATGRQRGDLQGLDADLVHLLTSWFNRGFLEMRSITWSAPADILERIIAYEAVHEIADWDELRRRLLPEDRRCFAFFHPVMPGEPLVFVEVALTSGTPRSISEILSSGRDTKDPLDANTATFYSISNCQPGLSGVSFGNFLLKQVVKDLQREFPGINNFVTLSPVPGFANWVANETDVSVKEIHTWPEEQLRQLSLRYFLHARRADGSPLDPVARFHLRNGAALDAIMPAANPSERSESESFGLMVSYRYDAKHIEDRHEHYIADHTVALSEALLNEAKQIRP